MFNTPLPHVGCFLVLIVGNLGQFLTPPPPNCRRRLWTAPRLEPRLRDQSEKCANFPDAQAAAAARRLGVNHFDTKVLMDSEVEFIFH
jgi:hypothetical protein